MKKYFTIAMMLPIILISYFMYIYYPKYHIDKHEIAQQTCYSLDDRIDAIYGKNGAGIDLQALLDIKDLVQVIEKSSELEQQQIACLVVKKLKETESLRDIDTYLIKYLEKIARNVSRENVDDLTKETANKLYDYVQFEQAHIVHNERIRYIFLQSQRSFHLPKLMSFWTNSDGISILSIHDFGSSDSVVIQDMMTDMSIFMGTAMAASIANQQIATQAQDLAGMLTQQSQTIQANVQSFQSQAQASQQKDLQTQITNFSNKGKDIQAQTKAAIDRSSQELNYLYQNIILNKPQQEYLSSPIVFDQIFSQGDMLTPEGYVWKNPFSVGDWEYEKEDDSFYQYQMSPIFTKDSTGVVSSTRAENNSIFTEYSSMQSTYSISGTITVYQVQYPFFIGIIFNKARWVSGDYEALRKARMVGIYGKSETDIGVYFSEQYTMTDAQLQSTKSNEPIQQPLQQILSGSVDKKLPLIPDAFQNLKTASIVLNFEITTTPKKVTFAFWNDKNTKKAITVDNLNSQIFIYHGIGFISPGAIAQFKLNNPTNLLFSSAALAKYKD